MQSFQLEGENDTETSDNKKSDGQHIEHGNSTKSRLPDDSHRAKNSQNAKHQIPPPVLCAIAFQICGIATQCKPSEHQPESNNKRNQFHADQRIEYQINTYQQINNTSGKIPSPTTDCFLFPAAKKLPECH